MTKVAEDYRSAPERSSHPLLSPEGRDFSRWWEHEPPRTLAGIGPFGRRESAELALDNDADVLDLLGTGSDDDENEPTQLLTRSLLQLSSNTPPTLVLESSLPPEPELGLPNSNSRLKVELSPPPGRESVATLEPTVPATPSPLAAEPVAPLPALDPSKLDELARRISHDSVLHRWMANSSPRAAAPSLLVTPKVEPLPQPLTSPASVSAPPETRARTLAPLVSTLERSVTRLSRSRAFAGVAAVGALALLSLAGFSRFRGAPANAGPLQASDVPSLAPPPPVHESVKEQAPLAAPKAPAFITLRAGAGAEQALVELIGDGHLRAIESLPARISANRGETYRVQARRAGYRDFSAELVFETGEDEKNVLIELTKTEPSTPLAPTVAAGVAGARAPLAAAPAVPAPQAPNPSTLPTAPAAPSDTAGETLVRVKASAKPIAKGSANLNLNSIPISTVIVDGRAQGSTPRVLQVTPGTHTVVFVHPELGRRLVSVEVESGTAAVAAVRF